MEIEMGITMQIANIYIPAIWALNANPTPHRLLLSSPAIIPAHLLPCLENKSC